MKEEVSLNLDIDPMKLDQEWVNHPKQYHVWAKKLADAQFEFDKSKSKLELIKADLDGDIREQPESYGLSKITENVVANTIISQLEHKTATREVNEARHELEIFKAAVTALEHKKRQLTVLAELWIRDYYSSPTVHGSTDEGKDFEKRTVRERGRRRREQLKEEQEIED